MYKIDLWKYATFREVHKTRLCSYKWFRTSTKLFSIYYKYNCCFVECTKTFVVLVRLVVFLTHRKIWREFCASKDFSIKYWSIDLEFAAIIQNIKLILIKIIYWWEKIKNKIKIADKENRIEVKKTHYAEYLQHCMVSGFFKYIELNVLI